MIHFFYRPTQLLYKNVYRQYTLFKEPFMYLGTKYGYIILIYIEHNAQRQEKTVISITEQAISKII